VTERLTLGDFALANRFSSWHQNGGGWDEPEEELETDDDGSDGTPTITCSRCGREIYEDSFQCCYCGQYVETDTNPWTGRPTWWLFLAFAGIISLILALLFGL
jgi:hypothetical protein